MSGLITDRLGRELLRIARVTLTEKLRYDRLPPGKPHNEVLLAQTAAFVTLYKDGALRGCIGTTVADRPLYRTVMEMTIASATRDPRFNAVTFDEIEHIVIEISVLTTPEPIAGPADVVIGEHGLVIEGRGARGLLLPQVAVERSFTPEAFLQATCDKARLAHTAWRDDDVDVLRFSAHVVSER